MYNKILINNMKLNNEEYKFFNNILCTVNSSENIDISKSFSLKIEKENELQRINVYQDSIKVGCLYPGKFETLILFTLLKRNSNYIFNYDQMYKLESNYYFKVHIWINVHYWDDIVNMNIRTPYFFRLIIRYNHYLDNLDHHTESMNEKKSNNKDTTQFKHLFEWLRKLEEQIIKKLITYNVSIQTTEINNYTLQHDALGYVTKWKKENIMGGVINMYDLNIKGLVEYIRLSDHENNKKSKNLLLCPRSLIPKVKLNDNYDEVEIVDLYLIEEVKKIYWDRVIIVEGQEIFLSNEYYNSLLKNIDTIDCKFRYILTKYPFKYGYSNIITMFNYITNTNSNDNIISKGNLLKVIQRYLYKNINVDKKIISIIDENIIDKSIYVKKSPTETIIMDIIRASESLHNESNIEVAKTDILIKKKIILKSTIDPIECPICLEITDQYCESICHHHICMKCLKQMESISLDCPLCRKNLSYYDWKFCIKQVEIIDSRVKTIIKVVQSKPFLIITKNQSMVQMIQKYSKLDKNISYQYLPNSFTKMSNRNKIKTFQNLIDKSKPIVVSWFHIQNIMLPSINFHDYNLLFLDKKEKWQSFIYREMNPIGKKIHIYRVLW